MSTQTELPRYRCHKEVRAAKIVGFPHGPGRLRAEVVLPDGSTDLVDLTKEFLRRYDESAGDIGYLVIYEDGFMSWSPSDAFEGGYTLIAGEG